MYDNDFLHVIVLNFQTFTFRDLSITKIDCILKTYNFQKYKVLVKKTLAFYIVARTKKHRSSQ